MLSVGAGVPKKGAQLQERYCPPHPAPPHPVWRRCHAECSSTDLGCRVMRILVAESRGVWLRNRLFLVAESSFFWLQNRLFLVAESYLILVAESPKFGCGIAEICLQNRTLFETFGFRLGFPNPWTVQCSKTRPDGLQHQNVIRHVLQLLR